MFLPRDLPPLLAWERLVQRDGARESVRSSLSEPAGRLRAASPGQMSRIFGCVPVPAWPDGQVESDRMARSPFPGLRIQDGDFGPERKVMAVRKTTAQLSAKSRRCSPSYQSPEVLPDLALSRIPEELQVKNRQRRAREAQQLTLTPPPRRLQLQPPCPVPAAARAHAPDAAAESTARIEAVMMLECTPTPNRVTREGVVISTNAAAFALLPLADRFFLVGQHVERQPERVHQRVDGAVAAAVSCMARPSRR